MKILVDWQPYPVDPYSAICDDHTYIHTARCLRKYHEGVKLQTLFLYYLTSAVCFISNQTVFKVKTEKQETEKIRGIHGFTFVLFCFVFVFFMLSLKPRPFVQSSFDTVYISLVKYWNHGKDNGDKARNTL